MALGVPTPLFACSAVWAPSLSTILALGGLHCKLGRQTATALCYDTVASAGGHALAIPGVRDPAECPIAAASLDEGLVPVVPCAEAD